MGKRSSRVQQVVDLRGNVRSWLLAGAGCKGREESRGEKPGTKKARRPAAAKQLGGRAEQFGSVPYTGCHTVSPYGGVLGDTAAPQATGWRRADTGPELLLALAATRQALHCSPPPFPTPPPPLHLLSSRQHKGLAG